MSQNELQSLGIKQPLVENVRHLAIYTTCGIITSGYAICVIIFYAFPSITACIPLEDFGQLFYGIHILCVGLLPILGMMAVTLLMFRFTRKTGVPLFCATLVMACGTIFSLFVSLEADGMGEIRAMTNGAHVIAELEDFRREHGRYPEQLELLIPKFMDKLPPVGYFGAMQKNFRIDKAGNTPDAYMLWADIRVFQRLEYYSDPGLRAEILKSGYHYRPIACGWFLNFDAD